MIHTIDPLLSALGHAVLQFLWQGTVIAVMAGFALAAVSRTDSSLRHTIGLGALVLSLIAFGSTFLSAFIAGLASSGMGVDPQAADQAGPFVSLAALVASTIPLVDLRLSLAWAWILGVLFMGMRHRRGFAWGHGLRRDASAPDDPVWQQVVDSLCEDLGLRRAVELLQSTRIESPAVIGWLQPVILVPVSALTGLTPDQLRSVLAHELAHIRRLDHLFNALLALIEVSLFFHPATWWFARLVRQEREHCCDLVAVQVTGNPRLLARALAELESLRLPGAAPVLAARSTKGPLMQRIIRILAMGPGNSGRDDARLLRPALLLTGLLACAGIVQSAVAEPGTTVTVGADVEGEKRGAIEERQRVQKAQRATREEYAQIEAKLKAAVAAGKLSAEEAQVKLEEVRKRFAESGARRHFTREDLARIEAELKAAVQAGKISGEDARKRVEELRRKLAAQGQTRDGRDDRRAKYAAFAAEIQKMLESGKLTEAQAKEKLEGFRRRFGEGEVTPEAALARIQAAVEAGRITPAEGKERIEAFRKSLAERRAAEASRKEFELAVQRVKEAVRSRQITRDEAKLRIEALKKGITDRTTGEGTRRR